MSSSEIRVDTIKSRTGLGTVTINSSGLQFSGIITSENRVDVKSYDGTPGRLDLYCESSNVHYARIQAPDHADFSGNVTLTLPNTGGTLLNSDVSGNVGIGTDNPTELLHLSADSAHEILLKRGGASPSEVRFANEGNLAVISNNTNGIVFQTGATPTEVMIIEPNGNVGIGTDNPQQLLDIFEDDATDTVVQIRSGTANRDKAKITKVNRTTGNGDLQIQSSSGANGHSMVFFTDSSGEERMHIDASGDVGIGTSTPAETLSVAGNVRVENSTDASQYLNISYQGIDFQNTGAGSSTTAASHLLDDYEEGLWTPAVAGSTSAGTATYANQFGSYEKIGRQVTVRGYIDYSSATGTGSVQITGLPFASNNSGGFNFIQSGSIMVHTIAWPSSRTMVSSYIADDTSHISPFASGTGTSWTTITMAAAAKFIFSITYTAL